jgi:predicted nucleic acid-binding protein
MIVVADTSPLNYLIQLGKADVLLNIYGRVLVPHAVLTEMQHPEAPTEVIAWACSPPAWLEQVEVRQLDSSLTPALGDGERQAISLALEVHADVLLIDERLGRKEAEALQIEVAGTLAVLLHASQLGYLDFPEAIKQLRLYRFRVSRLLESSMLARYEQSKKARE